MTAFPKRPRDIRLDILRGLFLIIMAAVHVPTPLSHALQEPFGFTSAAEGFVFLGAALAGCIYGRTYWNAGWTAMSRRAWGRARTVYFAHLALVVPTVLIAWWAADRLTPLANHFHDFLAHPWAGLALLPLLLHQPPLFDILPLYVVLLGVTPFLLAAAHRRGWKMVLTLSAFGWMCAQFNLDGPLTGELSKWLPIRWGSFDLLAWQFLWVGGLAIGETTLRRPVLIGRKYRIALGAASSTIVLAGFLARHGFLSQAWFPADLYLWMDKWTLGPLRLLNFSAWVVSLLAWNPRFSPPVLAPVALLGRHSLVVFSFHVPLAIAATTAIYMMSLSRVSQTILGIVVIAALFPWGAWQEQCSRRRLERAVATPVPAGAASPGQAADGLPAGVDWGGGVRAARTAGDGTMLVQEVAY